MGFAGRAVALLVAVLFSFTACSAEGDGSGSGTGPGAPGAGQAGSSVGAAGSAAGSGGAAGYGASSGSGDPWSSTAGSAGGGYTETTVTDPTNPEECTGISATAEPAEMGKVDIIWIIDASPSMLDETQRVADNINAFANDIGNASIDYRVIIITALDPVPVGTPLATSGNYLFVPFDVDSNNSLTVLRDTYGQYSSFLRSDAVTHFIILTDDESNYDGLGTPTERATAFQTDMQGLLGKSFIAHTISSEDVGGGLPCMPADPALCPGGLAVPFVCGAFAPGVTYWELATMTSGFIVSICIADWSQVFEPLKQTIIESVPLPCNYLIPPPPGFERLDPEKVNVQYLPPSGGEQLFPKADSFEQCADNLAWYYDDPNAPTEVLLCEQACNMVAAGGTINITFGCETVVLE